MTPSEMKKRIEELKSELRRKKKSLRNGFWEDSQKLQPLNNMKQLAPRRTLRGHYGSVYALQWGGGNDPDTMVSVGQDNKMIIWDANNMFKRNAISEANWAMTVAIETQTNEMCAHAGLDYNIYVHDISVVEEASDDPKVVLTDTHVAYVSCVRFVNRTNMISSSGDNTNTLWDVTTGKPKQRFAGHTKDVMRLSVNPADENVFVTCSVDKTCKLWDCRSGPRSQFTFTGHSSDVNTIEYFPDGNAFASGSDDQTVILFDIRACQKINSFVSESNPSAVNSLAVSNSGRILFAGYDTMTPFAWDTLNPNNSMERLLPAHSFKISCLGVHRDGHALASGAWDHVIKVWA
mmetsp:Transcript_8417/g.9609  ORF Transcript_8417/g.9609 Transcript_8417/m.9609 type:complete len:348 (-) Transcript_8417:323-1366(-)|eukprot:CAMPEP_0184019918 /NCGR_PEP_ID=MMETSP0954-20121128/9042_1 /TAXON_ID=627963 /ORGANISM="Aplanochytrium sp, Strain PBS07" /LENGTH=347 /DNA_ID=CAMNT_0026301685 /DNA_START=707 /DNA_END=1750 /DNA_ORIENTATION=+